MVDLHPILRGAARRGRHPEWAVLSEARRQHALRVGRLLGEWACSLELGKADRQRWRAAGVLHDALKDAPPEELRRELDSAAEGWPDALLHGPACARRLCAEGVDDEPLLAAIAFHTTGHPALDRLGEALYVADYVEPGRRGRRREEWRLRMPLEWHSVLADIATAKVALLVERGIPIPAVTARFWRATCASPADSPLIHGDRGSGAAQVGTEARGGGYAQAIQAPVD